MSFGWPSGPDQFTSPKAITTFIPGTCDEQGADGQSGLLGDRDRISDCDSFASNKYGRDTEVLPVLCPTVPSYARVWRDISRQDFDRKEALQLTDCRRCINTIVRLEGIPNLTTTVRAMRLALQTGKTATKPTILRQAPMAEPRVAREPGLRAVSE